MDAETKRKTNAPRVRNTTGQLSRAGQCWQGWSQWTLVTMTRAGTPGHLITYWHRSPHSSCLTHCKVPRSSSAVQWSPWCPINTLEPGPLSPVSPLLTLHRRRWWRWRCQHKPDTFSANLSECQPAGRAPACTREGTMGWQEITAAVPNSLNFAFATITINELRSLERARWQWQVCSESDFISYCQGALVAGASWSN